MDGLEDHPFPTFGSACLRPIVGIHLDSGIFGKEKIERMRILIVWLLLWESKEIQMLGCTVYTYNDLSQMTSVLPASLG